MGRTRPRLSRRCAPPDSRCSFLRRSAERRSVHSMKDRAEPLAVIECESARGSQADRHVKLLIQFAVEGVTTLTPHSRAHE